MPQQSLLPSSHSLSALATSFDELQARMTERMTLKGKRVVGGGMQLGSEGGPVGRTSKAEERPQLSRFRNKHSSITYSNLISLSDYNLVSRQSNQL